MHLIKLSASRASMRGDEVGATRDGGQHYFPPHECP